MFHLTLVTLLLPCILTTFFISTDATAVLTTGYYESQDCTGEVSFKKPLGPNEPPEFRDLFIQGFCYPFRTVFGSTPILGITIQRIVTVDGDQANLAFWEEADCTGYVANGTTGFKFDECVDRGSYSESGGEYIIPLSQISSVVYISEQQIYNETTGSISLNSPINECYPEALALPFDTQYFFELHGEHIYADVDTCGQFNHILGYKSAAVIDPTTAMAYPTENCTGTGLPLEAGTCYTRDTSLGNPQKILFGVDLGLVSTSSSEPTTSPNIATTAIPTASPIVDGGTASPNTSFENATPELLSFSVFTIVAHVLVLSVFAEIVY